MSKVCSDHKGNQFESVTAMCEYHGVSVSTYVARLKRGCSLEECLSAESLRGTPCSDHNGKQFKSVGAMCEYHGVTQNTYNARLRQGYSVEESLSKDLEHKGISCSDHNGKRFESLGAMCDYHGVKLCTYLERQRAEYSLKDCLSKEPLYKYRDNGRATPCSDHEGNRFESIKAMCKYHGVSEAKYSSRRRKGCSVEESLSNELLPAGETCADHEGKRFESVREMCEYHGVNFDTYRKRLKAGYSLEECLSKKLLYKGGNRCKQCLDHEGRQFESVQAMCEYHGVRRGTYRRRLKDGYSLEECLSKEPLGNGIPYSDLEGRRFSTIKELCTFHNITKGTFQSRLKAGYSIREILILCKTQE